MGLGEIRILLPLVGMGSLHVQRRYRWFLSSLRTQVEICSLFELCFQDNYLLAALF